MKMPDIEKQLKNQLSACAPSDFDGVWDKCSSSSQEVALVPVTAHDGRSFSQYKKAVPFAITAFALLICIITAVIIVFTRSGGLVLPSDSGYFTIDINPSIQVNYDGKGLVTSAVGLNGDGEELLNGIETEGKTYDLVADEIFEKCVSLGYFSADRADNAILVTASKDSGEKDEKMTGEISKLLSQKFTDKKMSGTVISDVDNTKWKDEALEYGINGQKYELILRYLEAGGKLGPEDYQSISIRELYSLIAENQKDSKDK